MLIMTMDAIPGYDITVVLGPVAATVRGGLAQMMGVPAEATNDLRNASIAQILQQAHQWGANAIVGVRFETTFAGAVPYVTAYGTAVRSTPVTDDAHRQYDAMVREGRVRPVS